MLMLVKRLNKVPFLIRVLWIQVVVCFAVSPCRAMEDADRQSLVILSRVIQEIKNNYVDDIETTELMQHAANGIMQHLDAHSALLTPPHFSALTEQTKGGYAGVGLSLAIVNDRLMVKAVANDSPAIRAGVAAGDQILKINNQSVQGLDLWEAGSKLKGPVGTFVDLAYTRQGLNEPITCRMERKIVAITAVKGAMLDPEGFGYLVVLGFSEHTCQDVVTALEDLEATQTGLKGLVMDLRNNPGGPVDQAVAVCDLFLDQGNIVTIKGRQPVHSRSYDAGPGEVQRTFPMVVLINGGSASSAEIVAGALQDHKRAVIAGTPSFGKGLVQTVVSLPGGYGLKYTIARYYTPVGRSIQDIGIQPDILLEKNTAGKSQSQIARALVILKGLAQ